MKAGLPCNQFGQVTNVSLGLSVQSPSLALALAILISASPVYGGQDLISLAKNHPIKTVFDLPDISQEQHTQIYRLKNKFKEQTKPLKDELSKIKGDLAKPSQQEGTEIGSAIMAGLVKVEMKPEERGKEQARKKALNRFESLRLQIKQEKLKTWQAIIDVLTPEQRAKLSVILSDKQSSNLPPHGNKTGSRAEGIPEKAK
ncbi:MAG: Spy/CpxP family protein refolding chaperone [Candidatus Obscuribacterales bacterium]